MDIIPPSGPLVIPLAGVESTGFDPVSGDSQPPALTLELRPRAAILPQRHIKGHTLCTTGWDSFGDYPLTARGLRDGRFFILATGVNEDTNLAIHYPNSEGKGFEPSDTTEKLAFMALFICRKPFTVKVGTIFEDSHIPLNLWLQAMYLISSSKKGISANQLHRTLGITLKSAWFLGHRVRETMRQGSLAPAGGGGGIVEVDEAFIGNDRTKRRGRGLITRPKGTGQRQLPFATQ